MKQCSYDNNANKQQNQRSGCLLLTLKQKDQAILQNPRASFMVKSSHNNGGRGRTRASVPGMEERRKKRMAVAFYTVILSPSVLG
jgi:hypothetical protein